MKRNQLKLRIWDILNRIQLSPGVLRELEENLSEEELGALVDLFSDILVGAAFIDRCKTQKEADAVFANVSDCKEMAARYYEMLCKTGIGQLREHVFCNTVESMTFSLQADLEAWPGQKALQLKQSAECLLNYLKMLRTKVDVPSLDISAEEGLLLEALENYFAADIAAAFLRLLLMYYGYVSDYVRVEKLLEKHHGEIRDVIIQEWEIRDLIENIGGLCFCIEENFR